ncbi:MAG: hypothetical protein CVU46_14380 [Chloroflexi bacterium HGW-Chloroflexi-8]|nr:MAG: hypothetical protein CVU46_14380 [Chloroflexi bacterium HGW-Chloroflexi-8]
MRKFFGILFISIVFFACLFAGIYLAENTVPSQNSNTNLVNFDSSNQINLLILVVDQLNQSPTNYVSAWTVIFYYHLPNGMIILPINLQGDENSQKLTDAFHLDNKRFVTKQTINTFQETFDMKWDGIIMLDLMAAQTILPWVSSQTLNLSIEEFMQSTNNSENVTQILEPLCSSITQNQNSIENLDWDSIYPSHLLSNLSQEKLVSIWTNLLNENSINCDWHLVE